MQGNFITSFQKQFPDGDQTETALAEYSPTEKNYVKFNLNIGWRLEKVYSKSNFKKPFKKVILKKCLGAVYCNNPNCKLFGLERRPASTLININKQECIFCDKPMSIKSCGVKVKFVFELKSVCKMIHKGKHTHGEYEKLQLAESQDNSTECVAEANQSIIPETTQATVSSITEGATEPSTSEA